MRRRRRDGLPRQARAQAADGGARQARLLQLGGDGFRRGDERRARARAGSGQNQKSGGSNASADTAQGARGASPEEPSSAHEAEALGRGKRASRVADRKARREREEEAREAAEHAKAQAAKAKRAARDKEQKEKAKAAEKAKAVGSKEAPPAEGEGKQGQTGDGAGSGSGCGSGGSGSGAGEEPNVEGLSVQLVKAYGGATTMLELTLPKPQGEEAPKVGLRRSASRSAFQSFLNLEDAAAAQVISLKVDPEVAARAEGALASLAGIAAVAEEGTGAETAAPPPPQRVATAQVGRRARRRRRKWRHSSACRHDPRGHAHAPHMMPEHAMGMMPGIRAEPRAGCGGYAPGGAMGAPNIPSVPPVDPMLSRGTWARRRRRWPQRAGPAGSAAAPSSSRSSTACCRVRWSTSRAPSQTRAPRARAPSDAEAIALPQETQGPQLREEGAVRVAQRLAEARPRIRGSSCA